MKTKEEILKMAREVFEKEPPFVIHHVYEMDGQRFSAWRIRPFCNKGRCFSITTGDRGMEALMKMIADEFNQGVPKIFDPERVQGSDDTP